MMMLRFLALVVIVVILPFCLTTTQSPTRESQGTASISGQVTAYGKPMGKIPITLRLIRSNSNLSAPVQLRVRTDNDGRYEFAGVVAGTYQIAPWSPLYALAERSVDSFTSKEITLNDGENVKGVDLRLIKGGVITGMIVDLTGQPLIEQNVRLTTLDAQNYPVLALSIALPRSDSDDRGEYRFYGVPPGRYLVSAGGTMGNIHTRHIQVLTIENSQL